MGNLTKVCSLRKVDSRFRDRVAGKAPGSSANCQTIPPMDRGETVPSLKIFFIFFIFSLLSASVFVIFNREIAFLGPN
jgi:hypothetical protein